MLPSDDASWDAFQRAFAEDEATRTHDTMRLHAEERVMLGLRMGVLAHPQAPTDAELEQLGREKARLHERLLALGARRG